MTSDRVSRKNGWIYFAFVLEKSVGLSHVIFIMLPVKETCTSQNTVISREKHVCDTGHSLVCGNCVRPGLVISVICKSKKHLWYDWLRQVGQIRSMRSSSLSGMHNRSNKCNLSLTHMYQNSLHPVRFYGSCKMCLRYKCGLNLTQSVYTGHSIVCVSLPISKSRTMGRSDNTQVKKTPLKYRILINLWQPGASLAISKSRKDFWYTRHCLFFSYYANALTPKNQFEANSSTKKLEKRHQSTPQVTDKSRSSSISVA